MNDTLRRLAQLLPPGSAVLCAVSGGADSVCLLHLLRQNRDALGIRLRAGHFNHRLRGAASDRDADFVRALCAQWDIPLFLGQADVAGWARQTGQSIEAAAREKRYEFLLAQAGGGLIATAHTADDNLETVLINLLRGTALTGLAGIPPQTGTVVRPLLDWTRADVEAYLALHGLSHVEDASNQSDAYLRNRLRHHVVPILRAQRPDLARSVTALSRQLRQDDALLDRLAREALERVRSGGCLVCTGLLALDPALRGRVAALWLRELGVEADSRHIAALLELAGPQKSPSARLNLPGGRLVRRRYDLLEPEAGPEGPELPETDLALPGLTQWGAFQIHCGFSPCSNPVLPAQSTLVLDYDRLTLPLRVRPRRPGDRLRLPGGTRTIKKLMIDQKLPAALRGCAPVIADGSGPVALGLGLRLWGLPQTGGRRLYLQISNRLTQP